MTIHRLYRSVRGLALAVAILTLSSCAGGAAAPHGNIDGPVDPEATIRIGFTAGIANLDPIAALGEPAWFRWLSLIYDRLFTVTAAGEVNGMLVTSWEYRDGGLDLVLRLREDATFRDGTPVDAAAVVANIDRARTQESPLVKAQLVDVTSVQATGRYEVTLSLGRPTTSIPYALASLPGFILHPALITAGDPTSQTNGSGAYSVEEWVPNKKLTLVRDRDDYWDKSAAQFARIELTAIPDFQAFANSLIAGQLDLGQLLPQDGSKLKNRNGLTTVPVATGQGVDIIFNRNVSPLDSLEVRQAINYAYDRQAIVDAIFPGSVPKYQNTRDGLPGFDPSLEGAYSHDPAKARALLAAAGHPDGIDLGELMVSSAVTPGVGDILEQQFAEAGIKITLRIVDAHQIHAIFGQGDVAACLSYAAIGSDLASGMIQRWQTPNFNPAGTTPEYDVLFAGANDNRVDPVERDARLRAVNRYPVEQAWSAPIAWLTYPWGVRDGLRGFSPDNDYAKSFGPYDFRHLAKATGA